jgi:hypothetical protein
LSGLNPVFTPTIHEDLNRLSQLLCKWFQNHLLYQQVIYYFSEKESIGQKYKDLLDEVKKDKKKLTNKVISRCKALSNQDHKHLASSIHIKSGKIAHNRIWGLPRKIII